jgi:carbon-monoxide dehydrogenase medium subunit
MDIATVGVASVVSLGEPDSVCQEVQITLGAVAPTVVRAAVAEALLRGFPVTAERLQQAAQAAVQAARPIDDIRSSATHRRLVASTAGACGQAALVPSYRWRYFHFQQGGEALPRASMSHS